MIAGREKMIFDDTLEKNRRVLNKEVVQATVHTLVEHGHTGESL